MVDLLSGLYEAPFLRHHQDQQCPTLGLSFKGRLVNYRSPLSPVLLCCQSEIFCGPLVTSNPQESELRCVLIVWPISRKLPIVLHKIYAY